MAFVDSIIQFLQAQQGERIVLESDQNCVLYRPGGVAAPMPQKLNGQQLTNLVLEVIPDAQRAAFENGEPVLFQYAFPGGIVELEGVRSDAGVRVSLGVPDALGSGAGPVPPLSAQPTSGAGKRWEHIDELFNVLREIEGSDLHLSANERPMVRVHGLMKALDQYEINDADDLKAKLWMITPERNQEQWEQDHDTDFAYELTGVARFRCNVFADRHGPGAVFRLIPSKIATAKDLNLSRAMLELCMLSKGLVVVTGPTGSGKSTTLAALVDHVNKEREDHIITIEDPIEFVHENLNCLITQREVHVHTNSFSRALRAALREDPDIVLVGEMRDLETIAIAIETAETGHLVFGTLHTTTAATTVDRIIDQFPADQQEQIRTMLSESLKAVIAQTLCRTVDGRRVAAFEVLLVDPACANLIREGKTYQLPSMMQIGKGRGCITMNDSLLQHVLAGRVDPKEAYIKAVDKAGMLIAYQKADINLDLAALNE